METNIQLERLYRQVKLVRGTGDRRRGQLCIMSLVAFLSGEDHSDKPDGVSPAARRFAIAANDRMPYHLRQRLKPFAPRLRGTQDGRDEARVALLLNIVHREILPHATADRLCGRLFEGKRRSIPYRARIAGIVSYVRIRWSELTGKQLWPNDPLHPDELPVAVVRLLARCAALMGKKRGEWYWLKAIDILDRLCDTEDGYAIPLPPAAVNEALVSLSNRTTFRQDTSWPAVMLNRIRARLPGLVT